MKQKVDGRLLLLFKEDMEVFYNCDEYGNKLSPTTIKYITNEEIYKFIGKREKHNIKANINIFDTIDGKKERLERGIG